jgi:hypothetical protein
VLPDVPVVLLMMGVAVVAVVNAVDVADVILLPDEETVVVKVVEVVLAGIHWA